VEECEEDEEETVEETEEQEETEESLSGTTICHIPPGNPSNRHTITVGTPAVRVETR